MAVIILVQTGWMLTINHVEKVPLAFVVVVVMVRCVPKLIETEFRIQNPEPRIVTAVPTGPSVGFMVRVGVAGADVRLNVVVAISWLIPLAVITLIPGAWLSTMNVTLNVPFMVVGADVIARCVPKPMVTVP